MCFDDEQNAIAQRYYLAALKLSIENEDPLAYAATLRAMSVQARTLGHAQEALRLARAAIASVPESAATSEPYDSAAEQPAGLSRAALYGPPAAAALRRAALYGPLAAAAAAHGDRETALAALQHADELLAALHHADRMAGDVASRPETGITTGPRSIGRYHAASHAYQAAAVRAQLGDRAAAIRILSESVRHRATDERRSRAITLASLAELHLDQGHLDESVAACHAFIDDYLSLRSSRAHSALAHLTARLRPHAATHHSTRQLLARAAAVSRAATRPGPWR